MDLHRENYLNLKSKIDNLVAEPMKFRFSMGNKRLEYVFPPVFILLLLFVLRPNFIIRKSDDEKEKKIDYLKLLLYSIFLGGVLDIGIYAYRYKIRNA